MTMDKMRELTAMQIRTFLKSKFVKKSELPKLRMELMRRGLKVRRRR